MRHSDSLKCSKPTELKSRSLNQIFIFSVINVIFQKILTDVCLLLPPSSLFRRHLSLIPSPVFVSLPCFGTCLNFLSTSDLQMNCMLRSWSTKPLVRSWTMPSTTWHLCRWPLAAPRFLLLLFLCCSFVFGPSICLSVNHVPSPLLTISREFIKICFLSRLTALCLLSAIHTSCVQSSTWSHLPLGKWTMTSAFCTETNRQLLWN